MSNPKVPETNKEEDAKSKSDDKGEDSKENQKETTDKSEKTVSDEKTKTSDEKAKHYFNVEVRDPTALSMEWFFSLESLKEKDGVMITYDIPQRFTLQPNKLYKPLDILFIDEEGVIKAIAPNVILSNINKALQPDAPMKAMLFLKGGVTQNQGISPGDRVIHAAFIAAPIILH
ncbi:MAG: DUF192 domain-containing protein [Rickettsiales bacterium]